jgi:gliding motility-associated-like protein
MTKSDSVSDTAGKIPIAVNVEGHIVSVPPWSNDPIFVAGFSSSGTLINASALMSGGDDQNGIACDGVGNVYMSADYYGNKQLSVANDILPADSSTIEVMYIAKYAPRNLNGSTFLHKDSTLCYNKGLTIYAPPGFSSYLWSNGHSGNSFAVSDTGVFWVTAQDSCASALHDTFRIDGICDCNRTLFVPNSFTPNGDGQNDLFYPRSGAGVTKITLFQVYNRWGTLLFERENVLPNDINAAWDGSYQGGIPLPDVYVYVVEAVCENGRALSKKGSVTVIR